jgi:hypothetical protein
MKMKLGFFSSATARDKVTLNRKRAGVSFVSKERGFIRWLSLKCPNLSEDCKEGILEEWVGESAEFC